MEIFYYLNARLLQGRGIARAFRLICWFFCWAVLPKTCFAGENALPDLLPHIKPSIVAIGTFLPSRVPREIFLGTGFALDDGGTVVTNAHVVAGKLDQEHLERYAVFYKQDNKEFMLLAELSALDAEHDLALLSIAAGHIPPLEIGDSKKVREGEEYAFTGYPLGQVLGLFPVTHRCIVSAISPNVIPAKATQQLNVNMIKKLQAPYDVFQLDAIAFPGNSGSPLYDDRSGKVIGIINKVFVQGSKENALTNPSSITYAIPAEYIKALLVTNKVK